MLRARPAALVVAPLLGGAWLAAHEAAYALAHAGHAHAAAHGYLRLAPVLVAAGIAVAVAGLLAGAAEARRGRAGGGRAPLAVAFLPLIGFAVQEHAEALTHGMAPLAAAGEPTFLIGLALQLPLALLALLAARLLLAAAAAIGRRLGPAPASPSPAPAPRLRPAVLMRTAPLALGAAGRAPPFAS